MSNHTPGPWRIGRLASYDAYTGQPYRNVWAGEGDSSTVVARSIRSKGAMTNDVDADALLIAAAPELLEALEGVIRVADRATIEFDAARAAIAKAKGEQTK